MKKGENCIYLNLAFNSSVDEKISLFKEQGIDGVLLSMQSGLEADTINKVLRAGLIVDSIHFPHGRFSNFLWTEDSYSEVYAARIRTHGNIRWEKSMAKIAKYKPEICLSFEIGGILSKTFYGSMDEHALSSVQSKRLKH